MDTHWGLYYKVEFEHEYLRAHLASMIHTVGGCHRKPFRGIP